MVNCAHPDHFRDALHSGEDWVCRIGGLRANASRLSHAELDVAEPLDDGGSEEFGALHSELIGLLSNLRVWAVAVAPIIGTSAASQNACTRRPPREQRFKFGGLCPQKATVRRRTLTSNCNTCYGSEADLKRASRLSASGTERTSLSRHLRSASHPKRTPIDGANTRPPVEQESGDD